MTLPVFAVAPYRLSGAVYGVAMNHRGALAALGDAVHRPPYKAPPSGVVHYIKPRNTLIAAGDTAQVDDATPELEVGAALGLVIGRSACAVREADALDHVAGYPVAAGFSVPHDSFFRPQIRFKARDAWCAFGVAGDPRQHQFPGSATDAAQARLGLRRSASEGLRRRAGTYRAGRLRRHFVLAGDARLEQVNEPWDRAFVERWSCNDREAMLSQVDYGDEATCRDAGQGGFEIRTFLAGAAAARGRGEIRFYAPIPIFAVGCIVAALSIR